MFGMVALVILVVAVVTGVLTVVMAWKKRREGKLTETNYRVFFITGITMTPIGLAGIIVYLFRDYSFVTPLPIFLTGIIYLVIGLANRDKWKKLSNASG